MNNTTCNVHAYLPDVRWDTKDLGFICENQTVVLLIGELTLFLHRDTIFKLEDVISKAKAFFSKPTIEELERILNGQDDKRTNSSDQRASEELRS